RPKTNSHNLIIFGFTETFFDRARFNGAVRTAHVRASIPEAARDFCIPPSIRRVRSSSTFVFL
ncbi:MAG: hypothetical protein ABGZ49_08810, partial [Akkermansiaceae bacterium]